MRAVYGLVAIALLLVLAVPSGLDSCSIAPPAAVFVARQRPADREAFLSGKVPVVLSSYTRPNLIAAFRVLSGKPLSQAEVPSLYPLPVSASGYPEAAPISEPWVEWRKALPEVAPMQRLDPYKTITANGQMESFLNCQRDAFLKAVATGGELVSAWGLADARLAEWVKSQDQVFSNCAGPPSIPAEPTAAMDSLLAAHRRYQIAAAHFYAGHFRDAAEGFRRIAQDGGSPWHSIARYLAARSLLRAGLVDDDQASFQEGKGALQAIVDDPAQREWHQPCLNLLHLWQLRVEPRQRLIELGNALEQPRNQDVSQEVTDFLYLLESNTEIVRTMADAQGSELAAWVSAVSGGFADTPTATMAWWHKKRTPVWLVAALIRANDSDSPELIREARRIPPGSPAFESASYYAIDREIRGGHTTQARQWADRLLARRISRSTRNMLLARRLPLSQDWSEFLKFAPRRPEPNFESFEGKEIPAPEDPLPGAPFLLPDAERILNRQTPLSLWLDAVRNPLTPRSLQLRLAFAGWLRAVMLDRYPEAREFLQRAVELQSEGAVLAKPFLDARDNGEARFAAIILVLRAPSICPSAPYPALELTTLARKRRLLRNGWYRSSCWVPAAPGKEDPQPFLTAEQVAEGRKESAQVYGQPAWEATVLLRETVAWTLKRPQDPRVPEALHDAVLAAYYRGSGPETGKYSKQAFDLLHQRYPKSPWTSRTPYWY